MVGVEEIDSRMYHYLCKISYEGIRLNMQVPGNLF